MLVGFNPMKPQPSKAFITEPDSITYIQDANGRVTGTDELYGVNTKQIRTTFYADGSVNTVETTYNGIKRTETYTYNAFGTILTMTSAEVNV